MGRRPSISRDALLDAAEAVVLEMGATRLTFDAVAERAGVSKGGLLHSFPTKEALLEGMVARLCDRFEAAQAAQCEGGDTAADKLKAYILATFAEDANTRNVSAALLAAVANDPRLLAPVHEHQQRDVAGLVELGQQFPRAAVVWLATIGQWFLEVLDVSPLKGEQRQQVMEELLRLADAVETPSATTNRE